ncbi:MAG: hypothetical protein ACQEWD_05815 [Bacteroidota bacterium]
MLKLINHDELTRQQLRELGMLLQINEETGVTDQMRLLKKYLNRVLPLFDIDVTPIKKYNVRKAMRATKKKQLLQLWPNHIAMA